MDVELQKMQVLGICGIFQETGKLIHKWKKIFAQITLAFILPLSLLVLAYSEISNFFITKITHDQQFLNNTQKSTPQFLKLSHLVSSDRIHYYLISIAYFIFSTTFSLLATSAVIYAVASIYSAAPDISFKHVIAAVPRAWKRLLLTFLCFIAAILIFNFFAAFIITFLTIIALVIYEPSEFSFGIGSAMIVAVFTILYMTALWYLVMIWKMANVVSVLEESSSGFRAMARAKALLKGKMVVATESVDTSALSDHLKGYLSAEYVPLNVEDYVQVEKLLVAGIVLYFVCKSYHQESVDKSALFDHLQGYLSTGYVALEAEDDVHIIEKLQVV
ncbi:uncharacterized protein LOC111021155 [Momordica charantia]|uniref:Uncharacterized protein LOC111021155 n=1 Tax=Momordica charantia TaxID=3673 RepID=A0A6J1DI65_MOMCH|nr:uncharacterized protein LOC111021155 [Momordica charantia]